MGKTRPADRSDKKSRQRYRKKHVHKPHHGKGTPDDLLREAAVLFEESQYDRALGFAQRALSRLRKFQASDAPQTLLPALLQIAQTLLEIGDTDAAFQHFAEAVKIDPKGEKIGADPFLWLAQLSATGGNDSITWFEQGLVVLKREMLVLDESAGDTDLLQYALQEKKEKASDALCSMVEVYMTDLSFDPEAENICDSLITEALLLSPDSPSTLQTLASVRISQLKNDDAKTALRRSLELWRDLPPGNSSIPDFPTRISLSRLLMEVEMETEAQKVLETLVQEDDQSVEAWYLGGWCQYLQTKKASDSASQARDWLRHSLTLYKLQDYEDQKLYDHAVELVAALDVELGGPVDDEDEWQDDSDTTEGDVEMEESEISLPM
ncbi:MAG: hypothetical protein Q9227_006399 [Pyrenula ochraceoflavens]